MNKAEELKNTKERVLEILERDEKARNSDDYLYYMVCRSIDDISVHLPFWKVLLNRKEFHYPAFESVRRSRQKWQQKFPELAGDSDVEAHRVLNEETFIDFARGIV